MLEIIENQKDKLVFLCEKYGVSELDVFGSAAEGDFDDQRSDIDLLVSFDSSVNQNRFDNYFAFLNELQKVFGRAVDLVEVGGLKNPYFIEKVNKTKKRIYVAA